MLNPSANAAQGFLADTEVRSNLAQRDAFENMRSLLQKLFVSLGSGFELRINKTLFQAHVVFFVGDPDKTFNSMELIKKPCQGFFGDRP